MIQFKYSSICFVYWFRFLVLFSFFCKLKWFPFELNFGAYSSSSSFLLLQDKSNLCKCNFISKSSVGFSFFSDRSFVVFTIHLNIKMLLLEEDFRIKWTTKISTTQFTFKLEYGWMGNLLEKTIRMFSIRSALISVSFRPPNEQNVCNLYYVCNLFPYWNGYCKCNYVSFSFPFAHSTCLFFFFLLRVKQLIGWRWHSSLYNSFQFKFISFYCYAVFQVQVFCTPFYIIYDPGFGMLSNASLRAFF